MNLLLRYFLLCSFLISAVWAAAVEEEADKKEESGYIRLKNPQDPSVEKKPDYTPSRVIIYENPQVKQGASAPKVIDQPPTQVFPPVQPQGKKISRERRKAEEHTEKTLRERLEVLRLRDEQRRFKELMTPLDSPDVAVPKNVSQPSAAAAPPSKKMSLIQSQYAPPYPYYVSLGTGYMYFSNFTKGDSARGYSLPNRVYSYPPILMAGIGLYEGSRLSFGYLFARSKHSIEMPDPAVSDMGSFINYSHSFITKYFVFPGRVKPFIGVSLAANQRFAFDKIALIYNHYMSFYAGPVLGLDLFLGSRLAVSGVFQYHWNIYRLKRNEYEILNPVQVEYNPDNINRMHLSVLIKFLI